MHFQYYSHHIDLQKVSFITTEKTEDEYEVSITFDGCLKSAIDMAVPRNDFEEKKISQLVEAFADACLISYADSIDPDE